MIRRGVTSKEHNECIELISKLWNLNPVIIKGNCSIKGKYFPDAINENSDYEVEVVPRKSYLERKELKWNPLRKKILVLKVNSFAIEKFNEIFVSINNSDLIKLK